VAIIYTNGGHSWKPLHNTFIHKYRKADVLSIPTSYSIQVWSGHLEPK